MMTRSRRPPRIARWWEDLPPRRRSFLRWLLPLAGAHLFVALAFWFHQTHGQNLARDAWTIKAVGFGEAVLVGILIVGSRRWPIINLGIALTAVGTAGLFVRLLGGIGPQPVPAWELNLFRAYYWVGVPLTLIGASLWAGRTWLRPRLRRHNGDEGVLE